MDNNYFYSVDRLVELGMGMAMASQMVRSMNEVMQNTYIPGSPNNIPQPAPAQLYVVLDNKPVGPFGEAEFAQLATLRKINHETLVWIPGQQGWKPLAQVPLALKIIALAPPPIPEK